MNKYNFLSTSDLESRLSEFVTQSTLDKVYTQIERVADYVVFFLKYQKPEEKAFVHLLIRRYKLRNLYGSLVEHLKKMRTGPNLLASSVFYTIQDRTEKSYQEEGEEIALEYKRGNFVLEEKV